MGLRYSGRSGALRPPDSGRYERARAKSRATFIHCFYPLVKKIRHYLSEREIMQFSWFT